MDQKLRDSSKKTSSTEVSLFVTKVHKALDKCVLTIIAQTDNKKRALNKMPCDNKENGHSWHQIRIRSSL